jgi:hypothetical protein
MVTIPLASDGSVRVLLYDEEVRYLVEREGKLYEAGLIDALLDRGVYRLLAELSQPE